MVCNGPFERDVEREEFRRKLCVVQEVPILWIVLGEYNTCLKRTTSDCIARVKVTS